MFRPTQFFCDSTSIHGLKYTRLAASYIEWLLPLGVAYYILIYELNGTITKFTGFHQKLTVKYPDSSEYGGQEFPAITICPKTVFRKSRVGGVGVALMMTGTNADWGSVDEAVSLDKHAVCDGDHTLESYHGSRTVVLSFTIEGMKRGWGALGQLYLADSRSSTNQCKFQGKNISCSNLFYNTWTDNGWFVSNAMILLL